MKEPSIKFISDRKIKLIKDFKVIVDGMTFVIKKGFITDGCSIPKIFWGFPFYFTPFQGKTLPASIVHDFFYTNKIPDKKLADSVFYLLLKKYKVNFIKRSLYYLAVKYFGRY